MKRTLNVRLFACLLVAVLVLGVGVHYLHAFQVRRTAKGLLEQAIEADAPKKAFVPKDVDALARFALALDKKKADRDRIRALLVMKQVLRLDENRNDVRRQPPPPAFCQRRHQLFASQWPGLWPAMSMRISRQ